MNSNLILAGIAVVLACLIGVPIAILTAERTRLWKGVEIVIDTLQTLPSFVYLMPTVMLFRVGDFTAIIAVVAYAVAPAIRYTAHGLRQVDPQLVEAGAASGCTEWQLLTKIKLKLALPEILLGLNQTILYAFAMLVIAALIGTTDLGQSIFLALGQADVGLGVSAGAAMAILAFIADRLVQGFAEERRKALGLA